MTTQTPAEILRSRLRKYFFLVFGMFGGVVLLLLGLATALKLAGAEKHTAGTVVGIAAPLLMLGVVVSSWVAVSKLWRCPACDKNVYWTVSWNMSLFAGSASPNCPGCGVELFTAASRQRFRRILLILVGLGVGAGMLGAVAATVVAPRHKKPPAPVEAPRPPG